VEDELPQLTIGEVAKGAGIAASSIRYYERIGLLPQPDRERGQRRYDWEVLRRIEMIKVAQKAGFSLREIKQLAGADGDPSEFALPDLADLKLAEVEAQIETAKRMQRWLKVASSCDCSGPDECTLFTESSEGGEVGLDALQVVRVRGSDGRLGCRAEPSG
jgi:DNA-binding transcriptional MerR regulator